MADENGASLEGISPTKKEESDGDTSHYSSIEEGVPPSLITPPNMSSKGVATRAQPQRCLSLISKKYDIDGDGELNEAEQAMRDLDKSNIGYLTNDKVYSIFQEQFRMQKRLELAKKTLIFFAVLLVILAVANLGVAFAAAALAKDTSAENSVLVVKGTGQVVATNTHATVFGITSSIETERRLDFMGNSVTDDVSITRVNSSDALAMFNECTQGGSVMLRRTWEGFANYQDFVTLCPGNGYSVSGQTYHFTLTNNRRVSMACNATSCLASGSGLKQLAGGPCVTMGDCVDGSWCMNVDSTTSTPGTCQLASGVPGCLAHGDCITDYCHPSLAYGEVGLCSCNPTTAAGCAPGKTCFTPSEIASATGISGFGPTCFFADGDTCTSSDECLSQSCVESQCKTIGGGF